LLYSKHLSSVELNLGKEVFKLLLLAGPGHVVNQLKLGLLGEVCAVGGYLVCNVD
jgi:hypothetical protein